MKPRNHPQSSTITFLILLDHLSRQAQIKENQQIELSDFKISAKKEPKIKPHFEKMHQGAFFLKQPGNKHQIVKENRHQRSCFKNKR